MNVPEISLLPPNLATGALNRNNPAAVATEFDAMVLQLLLTQSGLMRSLGTEGGSETELFGEMLLPNLAHQLATQFNLGFGNLLMSQAQSGNGEVTK